MLEVPCVIRNDRPMTRNHDGPDGHEDDPPPELLDTFAEFMNIWGRDLDRMTRSWAEEPDGLLIELVEAGSVPSPPLPDEDQ